jgi:hypothetical protein
MVDDQASAADVDTSDAVAPDTAPSSAEEKRDPDVRRSQRSERLALYAFVAYLVAAFPLLVFRVGKFHWFAADEWDYLAGRTAFDLGDLFRPHNEHLVTLPILVYRLAFNIFGINSYRPYQALIVGAHLGTIVLLRVVMRRAGVGPWMASVAAGTLVFFGPGAQNIIWAGQITFMGAVLFGLVQLLLADHDGGLDWRDWVGLLAGLAALLCSAVAISMIAAVGVFALMRRGWRMALFHTVPLGIVFVVWWLLADPAVTTDVLGRPSARQVLSYVWTGMSESFVALGHYPAIGIGLALLLVLGLAIAWKSLTLSELRSRASGPVALMLGAVGFFLVSSYARAILGGQGAIGSRYLYIGVALVLPALAVAGDAVIRRWWFTTPLVIALFVVGLPGNFREFDDYETDNTPWYVANVAPEDYFPTRRQMVLGLADSPRLAELPDWVLPDPSVFGTPEVTVGWLETAKANGKIPEPGNLAPTMKQHIRARLALILTEEPPPDDAVCTVLTNPTDSAPAEGDVIGLKSPVNITLIDSTGKPIAIPVGFGVGRITVDETGLRMRIGPVFPSNTYEICL